MQIHISSRQLHLTLKQRLKKGVNIAEYVRKSRKFFSKIFVTFFARTAPASNKANPHCINRTVQPFIIRNILILNIKIPDICRTSYETYKDS